MENDTDYKAAKPAPGKGYLTVLRYIYPALMLIGTVFRFTGLEFIDANIRTVVYIVYYIFAVLSVATMFIYDTTIPEYMLMTLYPLFMALSPVPYETVLIVLILIAVIMKYKYKFKVAMVVYLVLCILIGLFCTAFSSSLDYAVSKPTSYYSEDNEYNVDVSTGLSTSVNLYRVYGGILRKFDRTLFVGGEGTVPTFEWVDDDNVKINGSIINIHSDETYNMPNSD